MTLQIKSKILVKTCASFLWFMILHIANLLSFYVQFIIDMVFVQNILVFVQNILAFKFPNPKSVFSPCSRVCVFKSFSVSNFLSVSLDTNKLGGLMALARITGQHSPDQHWSSPFLDTIPRFFRLLVHHAIHTLLSSSLPLLVRFDHILHHYFQTILCCSGIPCFLHSLHARELFFF